MWSMQASDDGGVVKVVFDGRMISITILWLRFCLSSLVLYRLPKHFHVFFRPTSEFISEKVPLTPMDPTEGERASKAYCCIYYSYVELFSSFALGLSVNSHDAPLRSCEFFASIAASHILFGHILQRHLSTNFLTS